MQITYTHAVNYISDSGSWIEIGRSKFQIWIFCIYKKKRIKICLKSTPYDLNPMATNVASCVNEETCNCRESKFWESKLGKPSEKSKL